MLLGSDHLYEGFRKLTEKERGRILHPDLALAHAIQFLPSNRMCPRRHKDDNPCPTHCIVLVGTVISNTALSLAEN